MLFTSVGESTLHNMHECAAHAGIHVSHVFDAVSVNLQAEGGAPEPKYADLNSLVADYMKRGDKNGLAFGLKFPVPPDKGEEVDSGLFLCLLGSTHFFNYFFKIYFWFTQRNTKN